MHCSSKNKAVKVIEAIRDRLRECGLELHSDKTKIVLFIHLNRSDTHEYEKFDFLVYRSRPRLSPIEQAE